MPQHQLEFSVGFDAITGAREYQEDSMCVWPSAGEPASGGSSRLLLVLADGMGGHVSGETASRIACGEIARHFSEAETAEPTLRLEGALHAANAAIQREISVNSSLSGMGCTAIAAFLDQSGLRWVSVGDSVMYLFRHNRLYRLNEDHSLGALLDKQAKAQVITVDEARASPNRHSLRSALTGAKIPIIDLESGPNRLMTGDWLLIASDGLDTLDANSIATIVAHWAFREPLVVVEQLLNEVRRRGLQNQDNTSIIAVRVDAREHVAAAGANGLAPRIDNDMSVEPTQLIMHMRRGEVVGHAKPSSGRRSDTEPIRTVSRGGKIGVRLLLLVTAILIGGALLYSSDILSVGKPTSQDTRSVPVATEKAPPVQERK